MERLTEYTRFHGSMLPVLNDSNRYSAIERLAAIEDILGDEYELDRLKELVEADKEGRCVVFSPGYPVVSTYHKDEDGMAIREVAGAVSAEEYDAALKAREQE